jgi:hypothetical protein
MCLNWLWLVLVLAAGTVLPGCRAHRAPPQAVSVAPAKRGSAEPAAARGPAPVERAPATSGLARSVKGWGRNQKEAEDDAVKRGSEFLVDFLRQQKPPLAVTLPPGYARQHLIRGPATRHQDLDQEIDKGAEVIKMQCWSLTLAVTPQDYLNLVRLDRQAHALEQRSARVLLLARVMAGLLAALIAVLTYIRVAAWTRGVRTGRVRVVVVCLLLAAGASLVFLAGSSLVFLARVSVSSAHGP